MEDKELLKTVNDTFQANPDVDELFVLEDGNCFINEANAEKFAIETKQNKPKHFTRETIALNDETANAKKDNEGGEGDAATSTGKTKATKKK